MVRRQGEILKRFKEDEFFDRVGLIFTLKYFKFLYKFPLLKNSTLKSSYFKSNFKVIKKVCKTNVNIFGNAK